MSRPHRTSLLSLLALTLALSSCNESVPSDIPRPTARVVEGIDSTLEDLRTPDADIETSWKNGVSNLQVLVRGVVERHLTDDLEGDKHQRFILRLANGHSLLVAHNIDLAPRLPSSSSGKLVYVYGEYKWNNQGGVVHWTHHDPDGSHEHGWIQFDGTRYQ